MKSRNGICPLCLKKDSTLITKIDKIDSKIYGLSAPFELLHCTCGLVFQNDIFIEKSERDMFINYYDKIPEQSIETDNDPNIYYEMDIISKLFDRPKMLDFGSFWGKFALISQHSTYFKEVYCYELGKEKINHHIKIGLPILDKIDMHFELIRISNVLSHLHNNLLNILSDLIEKGEVIFIIDWNGDCELNESMPHCKPLWHVNTFTSKSLEYIQDTFSLKEIYRYKKDNHFGVFYGKK